MNSKILQQIKSKPSGTAGFVFINNTQLPDWALQKYGPELGKFQGKPFTLYDIDHPAARKLMHLLLAQTVPLMKNKNYSQLGYMLSNEPRWINYKDGNRKVWYSDSVSHYTLDKFRGWLAKKHGTIQVLNRVWGTQFEDFKEVSIDNPIDIAQQGQPQWYDWRIFNQERVVDWFAFMKTEIKNKDPKAKVHLKIMPSFFTDNTPISGIDLEALTEMSDISGNDVAAMYSDLRGKGSSWEKRYAFDWRELFMSYDFMKSVSPDHIIFNTESHLLSSAHSRDLYMNPAYARAVFWAAHTLGLNASQIWYWPRREDGSIKKHYDSNGYAGSNNQQPAVTHEVQATMMDLNTYSEIITDMQQQRKPLRIFYYGTSAAQRSGYMDDLFDAYESLNFEGIPLGFVTQNILNGQKAEGWDVVLIYKMERVTQLELKALQKYIEKGGVVLADQESLRYDEYGRKIQDLAWFSGLRRVNSLVRMKEIAMELLKEKRQLPPVSVREVNPLGVKTCTWKVVGMPGGGQAVSIINLGKSASTITLEGSAIKSCTNLLNGKPMAVTQQLQPFQVLFVQLD
ncbi:alpha-amylase family protein [Dyadobacter jejuensis]|uniref:alpha-amylase family protein n=1 Tax=Dyadobacter jejuensis TaxID=1082580 RepID=UPI0011B282D9|nr:alpha-amylase family protein [Dyadobacter jejuensis]